VRHHHIGVACAGIVDETNWYRSLGYREEGPEFTDPVQGIRGQFLVLGESRVELVEALAGSVVLDPWLQRGGPLYHMGYLVDDLSAAIAQVVSTRAFLVSPPKPAVAFGGRRVAFCMRPNRLLVELIEA
jgi:methylmalonyl-CoA/ethylmalonyl-CoA epimerase